jgi:hypothetical protein
MRPEENSSAANITHRFISHVDWSRYSRVMLDPVIIYRGPDQQFEDVTEQEKEGLAVNMRRQFSSKLMPRFALTNAPGSSTLRIRLTLTGAKTTTRGLSTFMRFDLAGGPYNAVQAARGKEGAFTGSVSYAVEVFDSTTEELLMAYVSKQYPNAWNLGATFGRMNAANVGLEKGAEDLLAQLR